MAQPEDSVLRQLEAELEGWDARFAAWRSAADMIRGDGEMTEFQRFAVDLWVSTVDSVAGMFDTLESLLRAIADGSLTHEEAKTLIGEEEGALEAVERYKQTLSGYIGSTRRHE